MTDHSSTTISFAVVLITGSMLGALASALTIYLIHKMKISNGHTKLVLLMSWYQLFYDLSFPISFLVYVNPILIAVYISQDFDGFGGSIVSNFIAFTAFHVVVYRQTYDVSANFVPIVIATLVPGVICSVFYIISLSSPSYEEFHSIHNSIYYYGRLASIGINFILCISTAIFVFRMDAESSDRSGQMVAIRLLAKRMIYYPVVQAIGRSGCAWYEFEYGFKFHETNPGPEKSAAMFYLAVVTPLVSIGYLVIYLKMQPNAYRCLRSLVTSQEDKSSDVAVDLMFRSDRISREDDYYGSRTSGGSTLTTGEQEEMNLWNDESLSRVLINPINSLSAGTGSNRLSEIVLSTTSTYTMGSQAQEYPVVNRMHY
jgi:hypothetical protein